MVFMSYFPDSFNEWWSLVIGNFAAVFCIQLLLLIQTIVSFGKDIRTQSQFRSASKDFSQGISSRRKLRNVASRMESEAKAWLPQPQIEKGVSAELLSSHQLNVYELSPYEPKATIILCLRGADPFLADCLEGLLTQNYQNYSIHIVIDSESDPAWQVVNQVIRANKRNVAITTSTLSTRYETCGLKCSALIQAVSNLSADCQIIALADADMMAPPNWLRNLVEPLSNPKVGLTTGNRWYAPSGSYWGSIVRYIWNVVVVMTMKMLQIPWAGTLALRVETLYRLNIIQCWQQSLVDDVPLHQVMRQHKLQVHFVSSLISVNREECLLSDFIPWATRQHLYSRLYTSFWLLLLSVTIYYVASLLVLKMTFIYALFTGHATAMFFTGSALCLYLAILSVVLFVIDRLVFKLARGRSQIQPLLAPQTIAKPILTLLVAPYVFLVIMVSAHLLKGILWRGIRYRIKRGNRIQMLEYKPYHSVPESNCSVNSIN